MVQDREDYYATLGVPPDANADQIREAYIYKVNILHPDRLAAMPHRVRHKAEEDLKKVNVAYEVLSKPERRRQYDIERFGVAAPVSDRQEIKRAEKPKPEVYPRTVSFDNVLPYVKQQGVFFVRNVGGPYTKVEIGKFPEWIRLIETTPLQSSSKLPMRVKIEAVGIRWGAVYSSQVVVRLDGNEAKVEVRLRTQKKPSTLHKSWFD
ncbi:MAG: DnaJ domain-containing protein [Desulfobacterales bacterium]|nr:DnaJ domain-containing protein [Desulfobacterales bacterium]